MQLGKVSHTARFAAAHRAVHQVLEHGNIFLDPLSIQILGEDIDKLVEDAKSDPSGRKMRIFIALRSRFAEESCLAAVEEGARQFVVLGAGLDTTAYRKLLPDNVRTFEVDHPKTQEWKISKLKDAGIAIPPSLIFVSVDFESQSLAEELVKFGFDLSQQTFFGWLGVVPYLNKEAICSTLSFIAGLPGGADVVFDYGEPPALRSPKAQIEHQVQAARVAALGEPWISYFAPEELHAKLRDLGYCQIEDFITPQLIFRYLSVESKSPAGGAHIIKATTR